MALPIAPVLAQLPIVDEHGYATQAFLRIMLSIGSVIQGPGGILDQIDGGSTSPGSGDISLSVQQAFSQQIPVVSEGRPAQTQVLTLPVPEQAAVPIPVVFPQQQILDATPNPQPPPGCVTSVLFNNGTRVSSGIGTPNGVVYGSVGDMFLRQDGTAGSVLYVKESGSLTNTGWTGK